MKISKFNILSLFLASFSTFAYSNDERVEDALAFESAVKKLQAVEQIAANLPGTPSDPLIAQQELAYLKESNELFLAFIANDCKNVAFKEGAVGGSAADTSQCQTRKVYDRIIDLANRYSIELVYKKSEE